MVDKSIREQLEEAMAGQAADESLDTPAIVEESPDIIEAGDPANVEHEEVTEEPEEKKPLLDPPQSWTADEKAEWPNLSPSAQATIIRRESDVHRMITSRDGEFRLGKDMKEVLEPYMPVFRETGVEPKALVHELLGTVNTLRNGTEEQKIMVLRNIADGYEVDLQKVLGYQNNPLNALYGELNSLKQQVNPQNIIKQLQDQQETARIQSEYEAFAEDPKNVHLQELKPLMRFLLENGQAKGYQEAYDLAATMHPEVRSTMQNASSIKEAEAAKRKAEIASKKSAAVSIKGSPSSVQGNANPPDRTIREELLANMQAISGSKI